MKRTKYTKKRYRKRHKKTKSKRYTRKRNKRGGARRSPAPEHLYEHPGSIINEGKGKGRVKTLEEQEPVISSEGDIELLRLNELPQNIMYLFNNNCIVAIFVETGNKIHIPILFKLKQGDISLQIDRNIESIREMTERFVERNEREMRERNARNLSTSWHKGITGMEARFREIKNNSDNLCGQFLIDALKLLNKKGIINDDTLISLTAADTSGDASKLILFYKRLGFRIKTGQVGITPPQELMD